MENAGCVTFHEHYVVFRSKVTDADHATPAPTRSCTRWPTCGSATSSPCAGGTTCGSTSRSPSSWPTTPLPPPPVSTEAWTGFATGRKAWGYRQDQLPTTHPIVADAAPTSRRSRPTSTASPTPRAPPCSAAGGLGGPGRVHGRVFGPTSTSTPGATPRSPTCWSSFERESGRDLAAWSAEWLETAGCNTLHPEFSLAPDGTL